MVDEDVGIIQNRLIRTCMVCALSLVFARKIKFQNGAKIGRGNLKNFSPLPLQLSVRLQILKGHFTLI